MKRVLQQVLRGNQPKPRTPRLLRTRLLLQTLEDRWVPATFTVTNNNDSGLGSFRQALLDAVAEPGDDIIEFDNVTGTILLTSGELLAGGNGGVTINGPGAHLLTIQQTTPGARVLRIDNGIAAASDYVVSGLTFTGGNRTGTAAADRGGGIGVASENVTFNNIVVRGNTAEGRGGGIGTTTTSASTFITIQDSLIENNAVIGIGGDGGGIGMTTNQSLTITRSTITGNTAADDGGAIYMYKAGLLNITQSTISYNRAAGPNGAGGAITITNVANGPILITNTTIANNTATVSGGAVHFTPTFASFNPVEFNFSTITGNKANAAGGGINREALASASATFLLKSTIVANNYAAMNPDLNFLVPNVLNVDQAAIGSTDGFIISGASPGVLAVPAGTPLRLGIPSNNGGTTLTQRLVPGSPLIDQGGTPFDPTIDQTGGPRILGAAADVGSLEFVGSAPVAVLAKPLAAVEKPGGTSYEVTLTYVDETGVSFASIDPSDLIVTGKPGAVVSIGSISPMADAKEITVTYVITPPGGTWDAADNGTWRIEVAPGAVTDTSAIPIVRGEVGVLNVAVGGIFTVTNANTSGSGSFAQAIADAQAGTKGLIDLIRFDPTVFSTPQTINLGASITINDMIYVEGPGKDLLTLRAAPAARHFLFSNGDNGAVDITFTGMTIRDAAPASGFGGAIRIVSELVTFRDMRFTANQASNVGGVIGVDTVQGTLVHVIDSEFSANTTLGTSSHGAAIGTGDSGSNVIIVENSVFRNNASAGGGGAIYSLSGPVYINRSLFEGNEQSSSTAASGGGALLLASPAPAPESGRNILISNSTFSNNKAVSALSTAPGGGAIALNVDFKGYVRIQNSTIANNVSGTKGGGIVRVGADGYVRLENTILDGNTAVDGPDFFGFFDSQNSLISNSTAAGFTELGGTIIDVPAKLTPLYNFGGDLAAHATLPGSPARDAGAANNLTTDQRGPGFPRVVGLTDIGALEFAITTPIATASTFPDVKATGTSYSFTVTYFDDVAIDKASVNGDEVRITGPGGFDALASVVSAGGTDTQYDVTYKFTPPGGFWNFADNGVYTVRLEAGKVVDKTAAAVPATIFGTFSVGLSQDLTVTTDADSGPGSLRQAIDDANAQLGASVITFDPVFFAVPRTITLTTGEILVSNDVTMTGTGPNLLTISGNSNGRIFNVFNSDKLITLSASGMTLRDGRLHEANLGGGAIFSNGEDLVFNNVQLINNQASGNGGAIYSQGGNVTMINSLGTNNRGTGIGSDGGFLFANLSGTVELVNTTISGNYSFDGGGAFYMGGSSVLTMENSVLHSNTADASSTALGGAVYLTAGASMTATNSTISGNTAGRSAGGIRFNNGALTLINTTVANNVARSTGGGGGGGIFRSPSGTGLLTLQNTVVANNAALNNGTGQDVNAGTVNVYNSVIFDPVGWTLNDGAPVVPSGVPVLLGPLTDNGGGSLTHLPAPSSPLRDGSAFAGPPATDQRGVARPIGAAFDVGSVESDGTEPVGIVDPLPHVTVAGGVDYVFTVTYYDDTGINTSTLGNTNLQVNGPGGVIPVNFVSQMAVFSGVQATYSFNAPGGTWDGADAGIYNIALKANEVKDIDGKAVAAATLGRFEVQLARNYVVTNTNDSGPGSLRQAVLDSNAIQGKDGADTITFDPTVFNTAKTITLSSDHIRITDNLTITGPGTKLLTIDTTGLNRHFSIYGPGLMAVNLSDMTLTGGKLSGTDAADAGGSLYIRDETVKLSRMAITNNHVAVNGGAITIITSGANLLIEDSLIADSSGVNGGAIRAAASGMILDIRNSTLSGNSAAGGGAISNNGADMKISNSTIANNTATGSVGGGGIRHIVGPANLQSTLVANNVATKGPDISGAVPLTADFSLIGNSAESNTTGTSLIVNVNALLGPLADNGGLTLTHALGSGSPAIDAGNNNFFLAFDQRGTGFPREFNGTADIGSFERQSASVPEVTSIVVNNGNAQRSRITSITVNFSSAVDAATLNALGAITLTRTAATPTGTVGTIVQTGATGANGRILLAPSTGSVTSITLTFDNANGSSETSGVEFGSLSDGRWQLAIPALSYASTLNDANLRRLFGDSEPNGTVDSADFAEFGSAFGSSGSPGFSLYDYDNNGVIDSADFAAFGARFGVSL